MKIVNISYSTLANKCPRCHQGEVFKEKNPYKLNKMFSLHETCSHCQLKYEREPSFFYGAMYVSYALNVALSVAVFVISYLFVHASLKTTFISIIVSNIVLFPFVFLLIVLLLFVFDKYMIL